MEGPAFDASVSGMPDMFSPRSAHDSRKTVTAYVNGHFKPGSGVEVSFQVLGTTHGFLQAASDRLHVRARRLFTRDGQEIDDLIMLDDNDIVLVSAGEDYVPPPRGLSTPAVAEVGSDGAASGGGAGAGDQVAPTPKQTMVAGYHLVKYLGRGCYGKVYKGVHALTKQTAALKFVSKRQMSNVADAERVANEIHVLESLKHPHVMNLYGVHETETDIVMIFEFAGGGDLRDYVKARTKLTEREASRLFNEIVEGVTYCHRRHIVHHDLKLENILLADDGTVKIADFGLSTMYRPGTSNTSTAGSLAYLAPEVVADGAAAGPPRDAWSLGVILYAMVVGHLPFEASSSSALIRRIKGGRVFYDLPGRPTDACRDLIASMLDTDPDRRATLPDIRSHVWTHKHTRIETQEKLAAAQEEEAAKRRMLAESAGAGAAAITGAGEAHEGGAAATSAEELASNGSRKSDAASSPTAGGDCDRDSRTDAESLSEGRRLSDVGATPSGRSSTATAGGGGASDAGDGSTVGGGRSGHRGSDSGVSNADPPETVSTSDVGPSLLPGYEDADGSVQRRRSGSGEEKAGEDGADAANSSSTAGDVAGARRASEVSGGLGPISGSLPLRGSYRRDVRTPSGRRLAAIGKSGSHRSLASLGADGSADHEELGKYFDAMDVRASPITLGRGSVAAGGGADAVRRSRRGRVDSDIDDDTASLGSHRRMRHLGGHESESDMARGASDASYGYVDDSAADTGDDSDGWDMRPRPTRHHSSGRRGRRRTFHWRFGSLLPAQLHRAPGRWRRALLIVLAVERLRRRREETRASNASRAALEQGLLASGSLRPRTTSMGRRSPLGEVSPVSDAKYLAEQREFARHVTHDLHGDFQLEPAPRRPVPQPRLRVGSTTSTAGSTDGSSRRGGSRGSGAGGADSGESGTRSPGESRHGSPYRSRPGTVGSDTSRGRAYASRPGTVGASVHGRRRDHSPVVSSKLAQSRWKRANTVVRAAVRFNRGEVYSRSGRRGGARRQLAAEQLADGQAGSPARTASPLKPMTPTRSRGAASAQRANGTPGSGGSGTLGDSEGAATPGSSPAGTPGSWRARHDTA